MDSKKYNYKDALNTFFLDCKEMLDEMESSLLRLEKMHDDEESINSLFRAVHTIKGSSGMFSFNDIEKFSHVVENLLDGVRKGKIKIDKALIAVLLDSHDYLLRLVDINEKSGDSSLDQELVEKNKQLTQMLTFYLKPAGLDKEASIDAPNVETPGSTDSGVQVVNKCWHISLRFYKDVFREGMDPQAVINYLNELGEILNIVVIKDGLPELDDMNPELCYIGVELDFRGDVDKKKLEDVFEFLIEDSQVRILPPQSKIEEYVKLINDLPEESGRIGEILVSIGTLTEGELDEALNIQGKHSKEKKAGRGDQRGKRLGEIVVEEKMVQKPVVNAAVEKQNKIRRTRSSIPWDPEKLDVLINYVGELVITGANVSQHARKIGDPELIESVSQMSRLIEYIRDSAMNVRMVQIGDLFHKFERFVRDLSNEKGKDILLTINGGETELDKTLIEKINDPVMHLIRNAVDHGISSPKDRSEKGKPSQGSINLNAYHGTGSIIIEVVDDGEGLNREKILKNAIEKGLVASGQELSRDEIFQLIFEPGFSTAEVVTNISGRGVGMDVVKRNIQYLRGTISLDSKPGVGTTVKIQLPLTLAIIDGFMVVVGGSKYILPLDMVIECSEISKDDIKDRDAYNFIDLRGEILPFMRLRDFFGETAGNEEGEAEHIVVVGYDERKVAIVVDSLVGESQTVIKSLGKLFMNLEWTIGATILGTGEVALILDVPMLIRHIASHDDKDKKGDDTSLSTTIETNL